MTRLEDFLEGVTTIAIAGHINPDGDCVGACLGTKIYLKENYPQLTVDVYLQKVKDVFSYLKYADEVLAEEPEDKAYDLLILCDISAKDRIGCGAGLLEKAAKTLCLDHHLTNKGGYTWFYNFPEASSASEVIYGFMDSGKISVSCAEALYTGIVHDTGVFQYSNTSGYTMEVAGKLMDMGVDFNHIIDKTFFEKTYAQRRILGKVMESAALHLDGRVISGVVTLKDKKTYSIGSGDTEGIVSELRSTRGVEASIFLYQLGSSEFKISLRSQDIVDVSVICAEFGGGGHIRAAGCNMQGTAEEIIDTLVNRIAIQLEA